MRNTVIKDNEPHFEDTSEMNVRDESVPRVLLQQIVYTPHGPSSKDGNTPSFEARGCSHRKFSMYTPSDEYARRTTVVFCDTDTEYGRWLPTVVAKFGNWRMVTWSWSSATMMGGSMSEASSSGKAALRAVELVSPSSVRFNSHSRLRFLVYDAMDSQPTHGTPLSPAVTLVDGRPPQLYTPLRKYSLLVIFCAAQFLDAFNNGALFTAIPSLDVALGISEGEETWIISAFQLTFASFLLISGRISDVYNAKAAFIGGVAALACISVGAGFVRNQILLIFLRALSGIAAAMTIPSALSLLVKVFVDPTEQARALGIFGGCGAVGNVLGLIIGAIIVQYTSWSWVFWFVAIVAFPIAGICYFLIPPQEPKPVEGKRWQNLDLIGVSILTAALILFIFAITSGSTDGWKSAIVLAPLIISVFLFVGFFYAEMLIPPSRAAVPPKTWFLPNFGVLFGTALLPYLWWTTVFTIYITEWQDVWHWSVIMTAIHMIPISVMSFAMSFTGPLSRRYNPKWLILIGEGMVIIATILLVFADGPERYWSFIFPAFVIGSAGASLVYTHTNVAIFRTSPSSMAGVVGAIFNGGLQIGSAVGVATVGSIMSSVQDMHGGEFASGYLGEAAAYEFLLGIVVLEFFGMLIFYRTSHVGTASKEDLETGKVKNPEKLEQDVEKASKDSDESAPSVEVTEITGDVPSEDSVDAEKSVDDHGVSPV
ncbi:MFS general substrate transporter [Wolfiporia cocos MD-104 SS10]|uniref:MFS general substrate transporter n=1 Tax=Wolfiporia cocos (strain MD-104) TaxID=742152 RepID=A0A2H3IY68_WOLCO|nr:MFS general substrate transporter [Wolfiporia cocos MD-104 SS10]